VAVGESDAKSRVLNVLCHRQCAKDWVATQGVPISRLQLSLQLIFILLQGNSDQLAAGVHARFREQLLQSCFH
jgi:hypothetical protein